MKSPFRSMGSLPIWVRLGAAAVFVAAGLFTGFLGWASRHQRSAALEQARHFASSVHQMTMAGLTGMMITGTVGQREVFLDQIAESERVTSVRVVRGEAVAGQFGPGRAGEMNATALEREVLETGQGSFTVVRDGRSERLRAVLPAVASTDYLGKNCLVCHDVGAGTVLGVVSVEVSLDDVRASTEVFHRKAATLACILMIIFSVLLWYAITHSVTRPLNRMTEGLNRIAEGGIEARNRLPVSNMDEVGRAATAFNLVLDRALAMLQAERVYRTVFEHATEAITVTDAQGRIEAVNPAFEATTGYSADEVLGQNPSILKSGLQDAAFYKRFWTELQHRGFWKGEIWNRRKDGAIYPEALSVVGVVDGRGAVERYIGIFSDITDRKMREDEMEYRALHDGLTGLPNRTAFLDRLSQAVTLSRRHHSPPPTVMYLDLDRFKWVNDNYGHDAGDVVLKEFARRIKACVRESDTVARLGGDEFTVLLPETPEGQGPAHVASKIKAALDAPVRFGDVEWSLGASIGVATLAPGGESADQLLRRADEAMYAAKGCRR